MTNLAPAPVPFEIEPEVELPPGVALEQPAAGGERVRVRYTRTNRALLALPRILLVASGVAALIQAFRHHVFIGFWVLGLPLLRWLFGPAEGSLLIGERTLELEGVRFFGGSIGLPRARIARIEIAERSPLQLFQRALLVRMVDDQTLRVLIGISAEQAEFVNNGLQRWLSESG